MRREGADTPKKANVAHYEMGTVVREALERTDGTMPEKFPTPEKSIKQLESERHKK